MAQPNVSSTNPLLLEFLKIGGEGWNSALFKDANKEAICSKCSNICCNAVELDCDHNENEIYSYCTVCLNDLISNNNGKCPIDSHSDPIVHPVRSLRRQIMKYKVFCPYSIAFKSKYNNNNDTDNGYNNYQNEGIKQQNITNNGCLFIGSFKDLITSHFNDCYNKYNLKNQNQLIIINKLKKENKSLNKKINLLNIINKEQKQKIKQLLLNKKKATILQNQIAKLNEKLETIKKKNKKSSSASTTTVNRPRRSISAETLWGSNDDDDTSKKIFHLQQTNSSLKSVNDKQKKQINELIKLNEILKAENVKLLKSKKSKIFPNNNNKSIEKKYNNDNDDDTMYWNPDNKNKYVILFDNNLKIETIYNNGSLKNYLIRSNSGYKKGIHSFVITFNKYSGKGTGSNYVGFAKQNTKRVAISGEKCDGFWGFRMYCPNATSAHWNGYQVKKKQIYVENNGDTLKIILNLKKKKISIYVNDKISSIIKDINWNGDTLYPAMYIGCSLPEIYTTQFDL